MLGALRYRLHYLRSSYKKPLAKHVPKSIDSNFKHLSFTFAIIALSARVSCIDGQLTREKYLVFRESFPLKANMCDKIRSLFTLACTDTTPLTHYATQITSFYPHNEALYGSIVEHLFRIAAASGPISHASKHLLAEISHLFNLPPAIYRQIQAQYTGASHPHRVLGVNVGVKASSLKKRYHALMRHYHPDRFSGETLSPELQALLAQKASEINEAYKILSSHAA